MPESSLDEELSAEVNAGISIQQALNQVGAAIGYVRAMSCTVNGIVVRNLAERLLQPGEEVVFRHAAKERGM